MRVLILIVVAVAVLFLVLVPLVDLLVGVPPVVPPAAGAAVPVQAAVQTAAVQAAAVPVVSLMAAKVPALVPAVLLSPEDRTSSPSRHRPSRRLSRRSHHPASHSLTGGGCSGRQPSRSSQARRSGPTSSRRILAGRDGPTSTASLEAAGVEVAATAITYCGPSCVNGSRTASVTGWVVAAAHSPRVVEATAGNRRD